jgi:hypothetical protein
LARATTTGDDDSVVDDGSGWSCDGICGGLDADADGFDRGESSVTRTSERRRATDEIEAAPVEDEDALTRICTSADGSKVEINLGARVDVSDSAVAAPSALARDFRSVSHVSVIPGARPPSGVTPSASTITSASTVVVFRRCTRILLPGTTSSIPRTPDHRARSTSVPNAPSRLLDAVSLSARRPLFVDKHSPSTAIFSVSAPSRPRETSTTSNTCHTSTAPSPDDDVSHAATARAVSESTSTSLKSSNNHDDAAVDDDDDDDTDAPSRPDRDRDPKSEITRGVTRVISRCDAPATRGVTSFGLIEKIPFNELFSI